MSSINGQNIERMRVNGNEIALAKINGNVVFQKNKLLKTFFGDSKQNVTQGYNELEPKMETSTRLGVTCTNNGDGTFTLNGTAQYNTDFRINQSTVLGLDNLMNLNGEYTLKCDNQLIEGVMINITQNETWKNPLIINHLTNKSSYNFENFDNCFVDVYIYQGTILNNFTIKPFLYKGTEDKQFEPYTGGKPSPNPDYPQKISSINGVNLKISNGSKELKIPINLQGNILAKVGDYADELQVYSNGDIVLNQKIEKIIFNGSENWIISSLNLEEFSSFYIENILDYNNGEDDVPMICDYFIQKDFVNWEDLLSESFIENASNTVGIRLPKKIASTLEEFKNWLQSNNIEVYYVLQNSTTIKVDNIKEELNSFGDYSNIEIETTYS